MSFDTKYIQTENVIFSCYIFCRSVSSDCFKSTDFPKKSESASVKMLILWC